MTAQELAEERRRGRLAGITTLVAATLLVSGAVWDSITRSDAPDGDAAVLRFFDENASALIAASVLRALGVGLLVVTGLYLYRAIKARRPEESTVVLVMSVYGPIAWAASTIVGAISLSVLAGDFTPREFPSTRAANDAASDVFRDPSLIIATVLGLSGVIALGFWLVKGSLDAMRVGLLSRFMGVLGVIIGPALVITPFGPFLLPLWLFSLGGIFLRVWPGGMPPAWEAGEAVPSAGEVAEPDLIAEAPEPDDGSRNGEVEPVGPAIRKVDEADVASPRSRPRKRKRRR